MRNFQRIISVSHVTKARYLFIVGVVGLISACTLPPKNISESLVFGSDGGHLTDAKSRVIISQDPSPASRPGAIYPRRITCVEPHPDVASTLANTFGVGLSLLGKGSGSLTSSQAEGIAQIAQRTVSIQTLQRLMFRACEAYANGGITGTGYSLLLSEINKTMVTLILAETAGARFGQSGAAIAGQSYVSAFGKAEDLELLLQELQESQGAVGEAIDELQLSTEKSDATASAAAADGNVTTPEAAVTDEANQQVKEDAKQLEDATIRMQRATNAFAAASAEISTAKGLGQLDTTPSAEVAAVLAGMQEKFLSTGNTNNYISACLVELGMGSDPISSLPDILAEFKATGLPGLLRKLEDLDTEREELQSQSIVLERTLHDVRNVRDGLSAELVSLTRSIRLNADSRVQTQQIHEITRNRLDAQRVALEESLNTLREEHTSLNTRLTLAQQADQSDAAEEEVTALESQLRESTEKQEQLGAELTIVEQQMSSNDDTAVAKQAQLERESANLEERKATLEEELLATEEQQTHLEAQSALVVQDLEETEGSIVRTQRELEDIAQYLSTTNLGKAQEAASDALAHLASRDKVELGDLLALVYRVYHLNRKTGLFSHCQNHLSEYLSKVNQLERTGMEQENALRKKMIEAAVAVAASGQNGDTARFAFCNLLPDAQIRRECIANLDKDGAPPENPPDRADLDRETGDQSRSTVKEDLPKTVSVARQDLKGLEAALPRLTAKLSELQAFTGDGVRAPAHAKPEELPEAIKARFDVLLQEQAVLQRLLSDTMSQANETHSVASDHVSDTPQKLALLLQSYDNAAFERRNADEDARKVIDESIEFYVKQADALAQLTTTRIAQLSEALSVATALVTRIEQHNAAVAAFKTT